jgi:hypothetical protein
MTEAAKQPRRYLSRGFRLTLAALLLSLVGSTFAANIVINGNNELEFGQGIYQIKACDQFIGIELKATSTIDGSSRVGNIIFKGLDISKCKGTALRLRLYETKNGTPLELYGQFESSVTTSLSPRGDTVILVIERTLTDSNGCISDAGGDPSYDPDLVNIINNVGVNKCYLDAKRQSLSYTPASGIFNVKFFGPLASVESVTAVTLESSAL